MVEKKRFICDFCMIEKEMKKEKEKQIRSLTWKYFFEQKKEEIIDLYLEFLTPLLALSFIMGFFLTILGFMVTGIVLLSYLGLNLIYFILKEVTNWLSANWEKANKRAREEIG